MSRFWSAARHQAGREFGSRHYRWFLGAELARGVGPRLLTFLGAAGLIVAAVAGYRWLSPNWSTIGSHLTHWGVVAGIGALWIVGAGVVIAVLIYVVRNWWRLSLFRPMGMRRSMRWLRRF